MKTIKPILIIPVFLLIWIIIQAFGGSDLKNPTGAPAGFTGSPGDRQNCTVCHGGTANPVADLITSNIPPEGYIAGSTYEITITVPGSGRKGFQVSPQNTDGALLGTLIPGTGTQLVGDNKYITHTAASTAANASWTFQWTAPAAGTGEVIFYGAVVAGQPNVGLTTLTVAENTGIGIDDKHISELNIYPNPAKGPLQIVYTLPAPGQVTISLIATNGQRVFVLYSDVQAAGQHQHNLSLSEFATPGHYVVVIRTEWQTIKRNLVVVR